jgi:hypothetical protein
MFIYIFILTVLVKQILGENSGERGTEVKERLAAPAARQSAAAG